MDRQAKQNPTIDYSRIYSPTKLNLFEQCPAQYHFTYIHEIYSKMKNKLKAMPQNIWPFYTVGKSVHNAITLFYHLPPDERTQDNLKKLLKTVWISEVMWNKKPPLGKWGGFNSDDDERQAYIEALQMLMNFYKLDLINPPIYYLPTQDLKHSIEDYKDLIQPLDDESEISGKFDLILKNNDGTLHIIDFKTSKKEEVQEFQLRFYKTLAEMNFNLPVTKATFMFLRTASLKEIDIQLLQTDSIKQEILNKIAVIKQTKEHNPKPSKLCKYCLFKTFCPAQEELQKFMQEAKDADIPDDLPF